MIPLGEPWRTSVLQSLRQNNRKTESDDFRDFQSAVERTSWVRAGAGRVNFGGGKWEPCTLELEQTGTRSSGRDNDVDFGTLSIFGPKNKNKEHLSLADITAVNRDKNILEFNPF